MIEVVDIGTKVEFADGLKGTITAICVRNPTKTINYEILYWDGRVRKVEWMNLEEFAVVDDDAFTTIGFKKWK